MADPTDTGKQNAIARTLLCALADEYQTAAERGRMREWRDAAIAVVELLSYREQRSSFCLTGNSAMADLDLTKLKECSK